MEASRSSSCPGTSAGPEVQIRSTTRAQALARLFAVRRDRQLEQQGFSRLLPQIELTSVMEHHVMITLEIFLEPPGATRAIGHHRQPSFDGPFERSQATIP